MDKLPTTARWIQENFEWSMGCGGEKQKGQCPVCCGASFAWRDNHGGWGNEFGHKKNCSLAIALLIDGADVVWEQEYAKEG